MSAPRRQPTARRSWQRRMPDEQGRLQCSKCKLWKVPDEFSPEPRMSTGRRSDCSACVSAAMRATYAARMGGMIRRPPRQVDDQGRLRCSKCEEWKASEEFPECASSRVGRKSHCYACIRRMMRDRYQRKRQELIRKGRQYRKIAKRVVNAKCRRYYQDHREEQLEYGRRYRAARRTWLYKARSRRESERRFPVLVQSARGAVAAWLGIDPSALWASSDGRHLLVWLLHAQSHMVNADIAWQLDVPESTIVYIKRRMSRRMTQRWRNTEMVQAVAWCRAEATRLRHAIDHPDTAPKHLAALTPEERYWRIRERQKAREAM